MFFCFKPRTFVYVSSFIFYWFPTIFTESFVLLNLLASGNRAVASGALYLFVQIFLHFRFSLVVIVCLLFYAFYKKSKKKVQFYEPLPECNKKKKAVPLYFLLCFIFSRDHQQWECMRFQIIACDTHRIRQHHCTNQSIFGFCFHNADTIRHQCIWLVPHKHF